VAERSDATGNDRAENLRILKGFQIHPLLSSRHIVVVGIKECDPAGIEKHRPHHHRWRRVAQPPANG
jgi:hypothetical protein